MSQLLPMLHCVKLLGSPYQMFAHYRVRMKEDIPYTRVASKKLVDPAVVKRMLIEAGYRRFSVEEGAQ